MKRARSSARHRLLLSLAFVLGCTPDPIAAVPPPAPVPVPRPPTIPAPVTGALSWVETVPVETKGLHGPALETASTWTAMIEGAKTEVVLGHFYATLA
ncbi:MAG: hypothetical protein AAGA56_08540, partial [Myxococcota bacterium]